MGAASLFLIIIVTVLVFKKSSKTDVALAQVDYGEFIIKFMEGGIVGSSFSAGLAE
jgi:hypothetical protein